MNVLFIYLTSNPKGEEHLGTASIASYLEQYNHEVKLKLLTFNPVNYNIESIMNDLPQADIVGFPVFTTNAQIIYELSKGLKESSPQTLISVGGPLATDAAVEILDDCQYIDLVVLGDGEETYNKLIAAKVNNENLNNIEYVLTQNDKNNNSKRPFITEIENKPWVSRQYLEQIICLGFPTARLTAARGCCASCSFCSHNSYTKGTNKIWRGRDITDVYKEVIYLHEKYGVQSYSINDGSFEDPGKLGKERVNKFCELVLNSGYKFHFWAFLRAETFTEEDIPLIRLMRQAGFTSVFIGIESQSETDLKFYNKRATPQANMQALKLFHHCGINVIYGFILFNPVTTLVSLKENYDFLKEIECWRPHIFLSRLDINYKTKMHSKCKELDVLKPDFTYLNTMAYRFMDDNVAQIWEFIEEYLKDSVVFSKYDYEIFGFNNFLYSLLAFMPNEASKYVDKFQTILAKISVTLMEYFYDLYCIQDFEKAKNNIPVLEKKMHEYVGEIKTQKIKMMKHELVRNYLQQFGLIGL